MLGYRAEIQCCQLVSQENMLMHGSHAGSGDHGPLFPAAGISQSIGSMRAVYLHMREGEEKGEYALRLRLCGCDVRFSFRHLELESQLCDFLIAGQNVPASFACFHKHWQKEFKFPANPKCISFHDNISFFKSTSFLPNSDSK